jgi:methionine synthase II (cobalamin-independent)
MHLNEVLTVETDVPSPIRTTDVGSFPLVAVDLNRYSKGAADIEDGVKSTEAAYFITKHNAVFKQKFTALGPHSSIPCYVQSSHTRDMVSQFLDPITRNGRGLRKENDRYLWTGNKIQLSPAKAQIAELIALTQGAKVLCQEFGIEHIKYRVCVTGPFEMLTRIWRGMGMSPRYDETLMEALSTIVEQYVKNAYPETKYLKPLVVTLDEPSVGVTGVGDFFVDTESDPPLSHLISCWNRIYSHIPTRCYRGIHLHASPYHQLAQCHWNLLEAHLDVIVTREWLINNDKYIRAAIMRTEGPTIPPQADLKTVWNEIQTGNYHPYLQPKTDMMNLLKSTVNRYGLERIPFAGPECGLGSWDWKYGDVMVLANLNRLRKVVSEYNQTINH